MVDNKTKILITGSTGFIGTSLCEILHENFVFVKGISRKEGDIRTLDLNNLGSFDQVIHLANRNFIPDSWKNPGEFFSTNIDGTRNILEFCRKNKSRLIYVSAYVYGQPKYLPIDEKHFVNGLNPYMESKIIAERLVQFYAENFNIPCVIIRPFNIYGSNQKLSFLIPTIVDQISSSETPSVHVRSLKPKRDFLHINDFNRALLTVVNEKDLQGIYNIGYGQSFSVKEIINTFSKILNKPIQYSEDDIDRPNEIIDVVADISKIKADTNWKPEISLIEGLSQVL